MHLLIKNGSLVTAADTFKADVEVDGERIVRIGQDLDAAADARVIDATDKYVLPGGVDPHTHLDTPSQGTTTADDYLTGTIAAACGGTTTIVNFCFQEKGKGLNEVLDHFAERALGKAAIDYGFHAMISDLTPTVFDEIAGLAHARSDQHQALHGLSRRKYGRRSNVGPHAGRIRAQRHSCHGPR